MNHSLYIIYYLYFNKIKYTVIFLKIIYYNQLNIKTAYISFKKLNIKDKNPVIIIPFKIIIFYIQINILFIIYKYLMPSTNIYDEDQYYTK